jgi:hypothetical protein
VPQLRHAAAYRGAGDPVGFADGHPVLAAEASVDAQRAAEPAAEAVAAAVEHAVGVGVRCAQVAGVAPAAGERMAPTF